MMRIPLDFVGDSIVLQGFLRAESYRIPYKKVMFVVDTGSPKTFISERDALAFQLPFSALSFKQFIRLGGSKYELLGGKHAEVYFRDDDGKPFKFDYDLTVARTTKKTQDGIAESRSCPSILGTDFLIQHRLGLVFRPAKAEYYLEMDD